MLQSIGNLSAIEGCWIMPIECRQVYTPISLHNVLPTMPILEA